MFQKILRTRFAIILVISGMILISCGEEKSAGNQEHFKIADNQLTYQANPNTPSIKLLTWNIKDLGRTKEEHEILQIAKIIKNYDIIAIQEVVAKDPAGAKAVAKIVDNLNRMGNKWDYNTSNPTKSSSPQASERYAFIWKTSAIKRVGRPYLDRDLQHKCDREPFIGKFKSTKFPTPFYLINFHSIPYNKSPEREIIHFKNYQERLKTDLVFICGDFNLNENHEVWTDFYQKGFRPAVQHTKTTLKRKCNDGNYLNHPIDNIYFDTDVIYKRKANSVDFVRTCNNLEIARGISDHLPVFLDFSIL